MTYDFGDVPEQRRKTMQAIESEGTGPERKASAALDELGVGYDDQPTFGRYRPDFQLEDGTVLQVHGCFWHRHGCGLDSDPSTNEDYWAPKFEDNVARDKRRRRELLTEHDVPFVYWVWECQDITRHVSWLCEWRGLVE